MDPDYLLDDLLPPKDDEEHPFRKDGDEQERTVPAEGQSSSCYQNTQHTIQVPSFQSTGLSDHSFSTTNLLSATTLTTTGIHQQSTSPQQFPPSEADGMDLDYSGAVPQVEASVLTPQLQLQDLLLQNAHQEDRCPKIPQLDININPPTPRTQKDQLSDHRTVQFQTAQSLSFYPPLAKAPSHSMTSKAAAVASTTTSSTSSSSSASSVLSNQRRERLTCNTCGKLFSRRDNLVAHQRVHTGAKPYSCRVCNKRFRWQSALKNHESAHLRRGTNQPVRRGRLAKRFKQKRDEEQRQQQNTT